MHEVGFDIVKQALIVGDQDDRAIRTAQCVDAVGDDAQGVDADCGLLKETKSYVKKPQSHLQNFVALLFGWDLKFVLL